MAVESLFNSLPAHWEVTTLGKVCERTGGDIQTGPFGSQLHASDYVPFGIPSIMPKNIGDNRVVTEGIARITSQDAKRLSRYLVRTGDIVYSRRGDVERRALIRAEEDGWLCGTGCLRVRFGNGEIDPLFAFYYLGHPNVREWIVRHAIGATMPNLNTSILSALPFVVPPPSEQKAIARILSSLDDKIELNQQMNRTLEAIARAIFKSWFVDFDPVRAKMDGRQPAGMDAATADLFPDSFEDSPLGKIPKGWSYQPAESIFNVGIGKTPPRKEPEWFSTSCHDIRWVSIRDMGESETFISDTREYLVPEAVARFNVRVVPDHTVLLSFKLTIGRVAITDGEMTTNEAIAHFKLGRKLQLSSEYLYLYLKIFDYSQLGSTSSIAEAVNSKIIKAMPILIPDTGLMEQFTNQVADIFAKIKGNQRESRTLSNIRDTLLPKLLSGEIRVKEAEKVVEAVA
jgi:type I restriction enzyme S subunit